eukprot:ANDGO_03559.mRNA.1 hypothetical protein SDRG_12645
MLSVIRGLLDRWTARAIKNKFEKQGMQEHADLIRAYLALYSRENGTVDTSVPPIAAVRAYVKSHVNRQIEAVLKATWASHQAFRAAGGGGASVRFRTQWSASNPLDADAVDASDPQHSVQLMPMDDALLHAQLGFCCAVAQSDIHPKAGLGVFAKTDGDAVTIPPGTVMQIYPGMVYSAQDAKSVPFRLANGEPNLYLVGRYDGTVVDAAESSVFSSASKRALEWIRENEEHGEEPDSVDDRSGRECGAHPNHPFAQAHRVNHPPAGRKPNVMIVPVDIPASFASTYAAYVPCIWYKKPYLFGDQDVLIKTVALLSTDFIHGEDELLLNYRLNPSLMLPDWYTPVDIDEDRRRWTL